MTTTLIWPLRYPVAPLAVWVAAAMLLLAVPAAATPPEPPPVPLPQAQAQSEDGPDAQPHTEMEPEAAGDAPPGDADDGDAALASPRQTVTALLEAMPDAMRGIEAPWQRVLATLYPAAVDDFEPEALRQRAEQLHGVLQRLGEAALEQVPDAATVEQRGQTVYTMLSPDMGRYAWMWERLGHGPDGRIELLRDDAGQWHFSRRTLDEVPALYASVRDLPPGGADDEAPPVAGEGEVEEAVAGVGEFGSMLTNTLENTRWWQWLALLGLIFAGLLTGKLLQTVLRSFARRLHDKHWDVRATIFDDAAGPANLVLLTVGLTAGLRFIYLDEPLAAFSWQVTGLLLTIATGWFLFNLVDLVDLGLRKLTAGRDGTMERMIVPLIRKTLRIFLVIMFALVIADTFFGVNVTAWIAGLGIAGLAVSLAAQDSIKNLFGSLTVLTDRPFAVGDMITFNGSTGMVEEIGFRSTKMRLFTGAVVTIPNMKFIDGVVENVTRRQAIRRNMNITVTYDTPPHKIDQALDILRGIMAQEQVAAPFDLENRPPRIFFNEFNADSLNLLVVYWYILDPDKGQDWWAYNAHAEMVNKQVLSAFNESGIDFAFPTQTLYLAGDPERQLTIRFEGDGSHPTHTPAALPAHRADPPDRD